MTAPENEGMDPVAALERRGTATRLLISDLEGELEAIAESTAEHPDDEHDPEGSTVGFERARVQELLANARRSLEAVEAALAKQAVGDYGRCSSCGGEIGEARLSALPTTTVCVACAAAGAAR